MMYGTRDLSMGKAEGWSLKTSEHCMRKGWQDTRAKARITFHVFQTPKKISLESWEVEQ